MRQRIIILLSIVTVSTVGIVIGASSNTSENVVSAPPARVDATQQTPTSIIDGAVNPELIPDHAAYSILFRLIAGRETEEEQNRIRSYIRQMGVEGADADALIAAAEEFNRRVSALDEQAATIRDRHFFIDASGNPQPRGTVPTPEERAQLNQLQRQKELLVMEMATSLQSRLSPSGFVRARQHVTERMKRRIKITPSNALGLTN